MQVSGGGFLPGEQVQVGFGPAVSTVADTNGNFSTTYVVPTQGPKVPNGNVLGWATGMTSNYREQAVLNVTARPATLSVSPSTVAAGSSITLQISNEPPGTPLTVGGFDNVNVAGYTNVPGTAAGVADAGGSAQATLNIPANAFPGQFKVGAGGSGAWPASAVLTITNTPPPTNVSATLSFSPATIAAGLPSAVSGSGFAPNESVNVGTGGGMFIETSNTGSVTVTADANGAFSTTLTPKPTHPNGAHLITASGAVSHQQVDAALNVVGFTPSLAVSPNPVAVGASLAFNGTGFGPTPVSIFLFAAVGNPTATVTNSGTFTTSGTIAPVPPGTYPVGARSNDSNGLLLASTPVTISATPPTITASATTADGKPYQAGVWTNQTVTVTFACTAGSVALPAGACPAAQTFASEGPNQNASGTVTDQAGGSGRVSFGPIEIDKTPPVVTYSGSAGSYTVDQTVSIRCAASDPANGNGTAGAGIASTTCQNIAGAAYTFTIGRNSYSATTTDKAGNNGTGSTSFTVVVNAAGLDKLIAQFVTDSGVAASLQDHIASIASAPNAQAKAGKLGAFTNLLNAQTGKSITSAQATIVAKLAAML